MNFFFFPPNQNYYDRKLLEGQRDKYFKKEGS